MTKMKHVRRTAQLLIGTRHDTGRTRKIVRTKLVENEDGLTTKKTETLTLPIYETTLDIPLRTWARSSEGRKRISALITKHGTPTRAVKRLIGQG